MFIMFLVKLLSIREHLVKLNPVDLDLIQHAADSRNATIWPASETVLVRTALRRHRWPCNKQLYLFN